MYPKWIPDRWNQRLKPVVPWWVYFDPYPNAHFALPITLPAPTHWPDCSQSHWREAVSKLHTRCQVLDARRRNLPQMGADPNRRSFTWDSHWLENHRNDDMSHLVGKVTHGHLEAERNIDQSNLPQVQIPRSAPASCPEVELTARQPTCEAIFHTRKVWVHTVSHCLWT